VRVVCARSVEINEGVKQSPIHSSETRDKTIERRNISIEDLTRMIGKQEQLSREQKEQLFIVLAKYVNNFTSRPGKCRTYAYGFQVNSHAAIRSPAKPIPFSLREAVRKEINQMIREDIIEVSKSPHVNSLVIVNREGKPPRICLEARKINEVTISDAEREKPTEELLQRFYGARFMTSLDLTSAFLQVELEEKLKTTKGSRGECSTNEI
jgi:hypothetical protein